MCPHGSESKVTRMGDFVSASAEERFEPRRMSSIRQTIVARISAKERLEEPSRAERAAGTIRDP